MGVKLMTLAEGSAGNQYEVTKIATDDEELRGFLFSLGCFEGETVGYVSLLSGNLVVSIRDGRYNIDPQLASVIECIVK